MMFGLKEKTYQTILGALSQFQEIDSATLFGSRAKGNFKQGSDVDIALKGEKVSPHVVIRLSAILNQELPLPYFFDVVHYESIDNQDLVEHIDRVGKTFYSKPKLSPTAKC